ncbi:Neuronal tryptophan hydroxylase [Fasciolopsis buskii]|uniref:Neuronal tryptophan hydroxylase n=1 Tax=Fasciolopsis buskii TaxID=27845 RepID=A0A8E0S1C3_9TREM|nr:Neuronal tryptophan hydroxylase [Fasciolopsis buski]
MTDENEALHITSVQDQVDSEKNTTEVDVPFGESNDGCDFAVIFSVNNGTQGLASAMQMFSELQIPVKHLETRRATADETGLKNLVKLDVYARASFNPEQVGMIRNRLREITPEIQILDEKPTDLISAADYSTSKPVTELPWFPRHISELDLVSNNVLMYGSDLDADHPGFKDQEYRRRRNWFAEVAYSYKYGQPIPRIEHTEVEKKTWSIIYRELTKLYETHACKEYLENLKLLQEHAGYCDSDIPQLEDVSRYLKARTGFSLRPVAGYISARDFLSGLAFRVFYCTQYIRHSNDPMYTPEPDCCHELLGHVPMLADPTFAQFSHEIGLASLGTSDEEVKKLATCYFFTIEFGLCRQNGQLRAYGAGLLSSIAELKHALSDKALVKPFHPDEVMKQECLVTTFQKGYFETSSFEEATEKMRQFAKTINRPFDVHYCPYTQTVKVVNSLHQVESLVTQLRLDLASIGQALERIDRANELKPRVNWTIKSLQPPFGKNSDLKSTTSLDPQCETSLVKERTE